MGLVGDIADTYLHMGDAIAQGKLRQGQIWGQTFNTLGQIPGQVMQQEAQQKTQQQQQTIQGQTIQANQLQVDAAKRTQQYQAQVNGIIKNAMTTNPDGTLTYDRPKLVAAFADQNIPQDQQEKTLQELDGIDASMAKYKKQHIDSTADLANSLLQNGPVTPNGLQAGLALAKANGLYSDQDLAPFYQAGANGGDVTPALRMLRSLSDKYKDVDKPVVVPQGGSLIMPSGQTVAQGQPKPPTEAELAMQAHPNDAAGALAAMKGTGGTQSKDVLLDGKSAVVNFDPKSGKYLNPGTGEDVSARVRPIPPASMQINPALVPSGDALTMAANKYLMTGELPPMGMGQAGAAARVAVMNQAAKIDPTASLARNQAAFKADSGNLANLQKTEGTLSAFESTAGKNIDQFLTLADKIPDTGVPWLNTPVRLLNKNMVGSANMAAIDAARDVAMREIARVTNDPKLSGALTDTARAEVAGLNPQNATLPQIKAVARVLKQDMANVHAGITQQIDAVKSGIGANPAAPAATGASGQKLRVVGPNGEKGTVPAGTPLPAGWKVAP